jgi:hypothetical protein
MDGAVFAAFRGWMIDSILNLVPHPASFSTLISMQQVQKIHFHKHMLWEKASGKQPYQAVLGVQNKHVASM